MREIGVVMIFVSMIIMGIYFSYNNGFETTFTIIMLIASVIIGGVGAKIYWIFATPGKTDINTMTNDEKKTHDFEKENLKGFSGGFFGGMAIGITNLMAALTKKPGYQQHPELFALVYGVITLGVGFFRDSVVQDLLNNTTSDDVKKVAEVIDTDD
ncbi:MAG: hypothetical protein II902_03890 [Selenomonadaceae bacterium]|nr:hypothetical protein [Selenomonadaceae bacterium]